MTTLAACGDVVRNIMACPWPDERQAVLRPLVAELVRALPPQHAGLLGAVGRRRQGGDRRAASPSVAAIGDRAGVRQRLPAAQVQDRRGLAGRQLRRRAGQRHRPRADAERRLRPATSPATTCSSAAGSARATPARTTPIPGWRRRSGGSTARPGRRRRRGDRHGAARLRQPRGPPPGPPQVPRRRARHRVVPRRGRAPPRAPRLGDLVELPPWIADEHHGTRDGVDRRCPSRPARSSTATACCCAPSLRELAADGTVTAHAGHATPGRAALRDRPEPHRRGRAAPARPRRASSPATSRRVRRLAIACPALPTCGQALGEAERVLPSLVDELEKAMSDGGLHDVPIRAQHDRLPQRVRPSVHRRDRHRRADEEDLRRLRRRVGRPAIGWRR